MLPLKYRLILASFLIWIGPVALAQEKIFALVPKLQHPFFEIAHDGCIKAAQDLGGFQCLYIGPAKSSEEEQIQILQDLITRHVAGIAVSPANAPAVARVLKRAVRAGIPVITFDSDLLDRDKGLRRTYVGTKNFDIGVQLGKRLIELKPHGGTFAIQSGGPAAANLAERIDGLRATLQGHSWKEVDGTPVYCNDDSALAIQQMEDLLGKYPALDAFIAVGGWPQFAARAYRSIVERHHERVSSGALALVIADTLPMQMELLKEKLSHGQVGQRPFEMGYRSMAVLKDISEGKAVADPIYTGLDYCTPENADSCLTAK